MKINLIKTPPKNPVTIMLRLVPENVTDDKLVQSASTSLRGFNVLSTTPTVDDRICLSLIFTASTKRAGSKP